MKRIFLSATIIIITGMLNFVLAQDTPMTQKPIISSSQDSASLGSQWPARGQDSSMASDPSMRRDNNGMKNNRTGMKDSTSLSKNSRYFYYPSSDVYYNDATKDYMYYDSTSTNWSTSKQLPANMNMDRNAERYPFSYSGTEPWKENAKHKMKYKVKKDGTIKVKNKD